MGFRAFLTTMIIIASAAVASAQPYAVEGLVVDSKRMGIADVTGRIEGYNNNGDLVFSRAYGPCNGQLRDCFARDGHFIMYELPAAQRYVINVSAPDYRSESKEFNLPSPTPVLGYITLEPGMVVDVTVGYNGKIPRQGGWVPSHINMRTAVPLTRNMHIKGTVTLFVTSERGQVYEQLFKGEAMLQKNSYNVIYLPIPVYVKGNHPIGSRFCVDVQIEQQGTEEQYDLAGRGQGCAVKQ